MVDLLTQVTSNHSPGPEFKGKEIVSGLLERAVRLIAYYLPQYHPIIENDRVWGKGFTDWNNVTKAIPRFAGHYQPHLPSDLGFYDLRNQNVIADQVALAKEYGVEGFCFHYYWFAGKQLLEAPLISFLKSDIDFRFCINWANENWTKNWDGGNREVIIAQNHTLEDDAAFIESIVPYLRDPRYIRVGGRPLICVYKPDLLPRPNETIQLWREELRNRNIADPFFVMCQVSNVGDPRQFGMDAAVGFPPHRVGWPCAEVTRDLELIDPSFGGRVMLYRDMVENACRLPREAYTYFHAVCPGWDNQARQPNKGVCFLGSTPSLYKDWLLRACQRTQLERQGDERIVFVNAWNEWAEGAHLEPDRHFGHAYLVSTAEALVSAGSIDNEAFKLLDIGDELFWVPQRLVLHHHWAGHIPFAFWLIKILRPRVVVELGTHRGNSYCAFCQALASFDVDAYAFAVDEWRGDLHMNVDSRDLAELRSYHDPLYASFSTLMPMSFEHARRPFSVGQVELLHIDGTHTYEAVKNDFDTWISALSDRGVIIFHDTNEYSENFGVWKLWRELSEIYPSFEFKHSHGLGVLGVGSQLPKLLHHLFELNEKYEAAVNVREIFALQGQKWVDKLLKNS